MQTFFSQLTDSIKAMVGQVTEATKSLTRKVLNTRYGFQLRAKIMPYSTCFSHSVSNLLSSIGIAITPDEVTTRVNSPEYTAWARQNVWGASANIGKLQIFWATQLRCINEELKKSGKDREYKAIFNQSTNEAYIKSQLLSDAPVVIDTYPVYYKTGTRLGHIVAIVGFEYGWVPSPETLGSEAIYQEWVKRYGPDPINVYFLDDPFGPMFMNYLGNENVPTPIEGDNTPIPMELFNKGIRGTNSLSLQKL